jgi:chorismate mutase
MISPFRPYKVSVDDAGNVSRVETGAAGAHPAPFIPGAVREPYRLYDDLDDQDQQHKPQIIFKSQEHADNILRSVTRLLLLKEQALNTMHEMYFAMAEECVRQGYQLPVATPAIEQALYQTNRSMSEYAAGIRITTKREMINVLRRTWNSIKRRGINSQLIDRILQSTTEANLHYQQTRHGKYTVPDSHTTNKE